MWTSSDTKRPRVEGKLWGRRRRRGRRGRGARPLLVDRGTNPDPPLQAFDVVWDVDAPESDEVDGGDGDPDAVLASIPCYPV